MTHTPRSSSAVSACNAASVSTKHSIVANIGEIIPAPLHWALNRTGPAVQLDLEARALLEQISGFDRALKIAVALAAQQRPGGEDAFQHRAHRQQVADAAGRRERHRGGVNLHRECGGALRLGGVVEPAPTGGGVRAARVREHGAEGVQLDSARA